MKSALLLGTCWATVAGQTVHLRVEDANHVPVPGVRVTLRDANDAATQGFTSPAGTVNLTAPGPGWLRLTAEKEHYHTVQGEARADEPSSDVVIVLERKSERSETLEVSGATSAASLDTTSVRQGLSNREIINIPYPNTNDFRAALRAIPGIVRDQRGGIHLNGAAEDQALYTLNGFNLNDPLSNRFDARLSVESVQSVEVTTGNLAAEFGKGSAGALAVRSLSGDDKFRPMITNFMPGFENRKGWTIGDWQPRLGLSGPLRRGHAWFSNTTDPQYLKTVIRDLPKGEDRYPSLRLTNLTSVQANLTPGQVASFHFLVNAWTSARTGLTAIDPRETTIDRRTRQWFLAARDQIYFANHALLEFGYASNRTFAREIPQGTGILRFTPDGKRGNHYIDATREASRDQVLANLFLPSFSWKGTHQLKAGADLDRLRYRQSVRRTGFENFSLAGTLTRRTLFHGNGDLAHGNIESAVYLQDSWRVRPGLLIDTGVRADHDRLVGVWSPAARFGIGWVPRRMPDTKLYAGASQIYDATGLRLFARPLDQYSLSTYYEPSGVIRGPALQMFRRRPDPLDRPRAWNLNAGVARAWRNGLSARVDWVRRRGSRGFTYAPVEDALPAAGDFGARVIDAVYELGNFRRDRYDSLSLSLRHVIRRQYEWAGNYTRSRARSNAVVDVTAEDSTTVLDNAGPMPWDAPHRFTGWWYLPLPWKDWAAASFVDFRSGFPFSLRNELGTIVGPVNTRRFPRFFELNLHFERRFTWRGHRWAIRGGANNVTGRVNPDSVNPFLLPVRFHGGAGRAFNVRIRWLGRAS